MPPKALFGVPRPDPSLPPAQGVHSQRACGTIACDIPIRIDQGGETMKIVVIGGTGLIGSKAVAILRQGGHEVIAASPSTGVNTITGEGLTAAMAGAQVVIDLANAPSWEDQAVLEFFETSGRNVLAAEAAAGVRHHVALSIVGTDRMPDNGYQNMAEDHTCKGVGECHPYREFEGM